MAGIEAFVHQNLAAAWLLIIAAFLVLFKCADAFVDTSVALAERFHIPRLVIGIVLVSLATTAPELSVSLTAALRGSPEMALGNAIGSVICDDGLALGLAGVVAAAPIAVMPPVLNGAAVFLILIQLFMFACVFFDATLQRPEGAVLVGLFAGYLLLLFWQHRRGVLTEEPVLAGHTASQEKTIAGLGLLFGLSLAGIIVASECIIMSAETIARSFHMSEAVIALTLVAFGTSIPEVATCVTAARKGEGSIAVGNILGADIMNICWVAGASSIANDLTLLKKDLYFMFPAMFVIVGAMLLMLRRGYRLTRAKGLVLLLLYGAYLAASWLLLPGK